MTSKLSPAAQALAGLLFDFKTFATKALKIVTKDAKTLPLLLNTAQEYLHERIEDQLARTGMVRIIVLKGRQQGVSTYVAARYYWRAVTGVGKRFSILTHLQEATDNLFNMVKHYHDNMPAIIKPRVRSDNAKELSFEKLKTKYGVATAGSRGTGRSATAQYMHGSEVAFWPNAEKHMAGIGQIVPNSPGTEVILESTANGIGNLFYNMVMKALAGKGDYELVFIPWFWQSEYRRTPPADVEWSPEELEYKETFGLDWSQLYWRQLKVTDDFAGDDTLFDQEYPATIEMAFLAGTSKALIRPMPVVRAINNADAPDDCRRDPLVLGVDPAEYGDDDTALVLRRGRKVLGTWRYSKEGNAQIAGRILVLVERQKQRRDPIDAIFVDVTGVGTGVEAFLTEAGLRNVHRVHNGETAIEEEKYRNRGAECWVHMKEWIEDVNRPASLPAKGWVDGVLKEDKKLQAELSSREFTYDVRRRFVLQSKEEMRRKGIPSPNVADALALTFATSVQKTVKEEVETLEEKLRRLRANSGRRTRGMAA